MYEKIPNDKIEVSRPSSLRSEFFKHISGGKDSF